MISVATMVHWASSIVHWPREVLFEARRSGPAIPCKGGQKPPVQNGRNVPEQRAERPDRIVDFSPVERADPAAAALNQIPYGPTPSNRVQLLSEVARWHRLRTGGSCRGQRQHRSRPRSDPEKRPDPRTRSAKGGVFSRIRRLSQAANRWRRFS
jgi:hypothetical protein